ncbi:MAG: hypothetical protein LC808_03250 [Actinobacteria bacterium]|nr:hypothetical protein [Actinomycetota bacterium]
MIELLEELSLAVGTVSKADATQVVDAVNRRVLALLNGQVIKLYWKEEGERGLILNPFTFINKTQHADPRPFELPREPNGVLSWVFLSQEPLLLEDIQNKDLSEPSKNEISGGYIEPQRLDLRKTTSMDSTLCIPLTVRGDVGGLWAVELNTSGRLNMGVLRLMQQLGKSLASFICNADFYAFDQLKTTRAVSQFLDSISSFRFDRVLLEERYRTGFIARPFSPDFGDIERKIVALLKAYGIRARHYEPEGGQHWVIDDIMEQIGSSHFCIADITGSNPNVLAETGMMMILRKHYLLLRKKGDPAPIPFNLNQIPLHEYEVRNGKGELQVWNAADHQFRPFEVDLERFISQLPPESGFESATRWHG